MSLPGNGEWSQWSKFVLAELRRLGNASEVHSQGLVDLRIDMLKALQESNKAISSLQQRAGLTGLLAGLVPALGAALWWLISR